MREIQLLEEFLLAVVAFVNGLYGQLTPQYITSNQPDSDKCTPLLPETLRRMYQRQMMAGPKRISSVYSLHYIAVSRTVVREAETFTYTLISASTYNKLAIRKSRLHVTPGPRVHAEHAYCLDL